MKFYVIPGEVASAINSELNGIDALSDETFKEISIVYSKADFQQAFNDNTINTNVEYIRIL